ncbi:hypothetical protein DXG03_006349 [Asterophora parasitica]|uniref:Uncharacterized protein n=1 Tax=Asterophora parasitica TaxID=117018 RepID=A0A9P7G8V5_9AGAR|nr:hypothetical protein DXG03_006349 [Asterophora parasitica]
MLASAPAPAPVPIPAPLPVPVAPAPPKMQRKSLDRNKATELTRELWDVRRQITAGIARETALLSKLKDVDPETHARVESTDRAMTGVNGYTRSKGLQEAQEDAMIRVSLLAMQAELAEEKRKKAEVETALDDIKRECKEPFVVPAMIEAFYMISKITTQAMDLAGTSAAAG